MKRRIRGRDWDLDPAVESSTSPLTAPASGAASITDGSDGDAIWSTSPVLLSDYFEVAELTWENGNLTSHGFGVVPKTGKYGGGIRRCSGDFGGTLEAVVDESANRAQTFSPRGSNSIVHTAAWPLGELRASYTPDAVVPSEAGRTLFETDGKEEEEAMQLVLPCEGGAKRARMDRLDVVVRASQVSSHLLVPEAAGSSHSAMVALEATCIADGGTCRTGHDDLVTATKYSKNNSGSLSLLRDGGHENGSSETDNTSIGPRDAPIVGLSGRSRLQEEVHEEELEVNAAKGNNGGTARSISTKRSRAAAVHNESERKRRDRINEKMKTLQKLVPNSSKTDKASMLDEVIQYLKQLRAQVQVMNTMNSIAMVPIAAAMSPLHQMPMVAANAAQLAQMAGLGFGLTNLQNAQQAVPCATAGCTAAGGLTLPAEPHFLNPCAFVPLATTCWDDRSQLGSPAAKPLVANALLDPGFSSFLADAQTSQQPSRCPKQPGAGAGSMDAYNSMATGLCQRLYLQSQLANNPKL